MNILPDSNQIRQIKWMLIVNSIKLMMKRLSIDRNRKEFAYCLNMIRLLDNVTDLWLNIWWDCFSHRRSLQRFSFVFFTRIDFVILTKDKTEAMITNVKWTLQLAIDGEAFTFFTSN